MGEDSLLTKKIDYPDPWLISLLKRISDYFDTHSRSAYLVGGPVRNLLLHEPITDWDIAVEGETHVLARQLANTLGGFYAYLHERASRVTVKKEQQEATFDFAPLQGNSITTDLAARDFTINAIALPLPQFLNALTNSTPFSFIDPTGGQRDLQTRTVRAVSDRVFQDDPLRLLRALRFCARYSLSIEGHTAALLARNASLLPQVASERIHDEFYALLQLPHATDHLRLLDRHGLLTVLVPEFIPARSMPQPPLHYWDVFEHSLESVAALERLSALLQSTPDLIEKSPLEAKDTHDLREISSLLHEAQQQGIFQFATLAEPVSKLAALLHDIGKPSTYARDEEGNITFYHHPQQGVPVAQKILRRLNTSSADRRLVQQVVAHHMRPGQLSTDTVTQRAVRRYFVDLGPTGILVALISLADHLAMRGPQPLTEHWYRHLATVRLLLTRYIREREQLLPPRLLQTEELMRRLNLPPGPLVGQLLEAISEAQAEGRIASKEDALWFAEEYLQKKSDR